MALHKNPEDKKRYLPIPYNELGHLAQCSPIPTSLQQMKVFKYDTVKYPFREAIADILNVREEDLEKLHETEEGRKALEDELSGAQHRRRGKQPHYLRVWTRAGQTGARDSFHTILDCFMAEFVARRMAGAGAGDTAQEPGGVSKGPYF